MLARAADGDDLTGLPRHVVSVNELAHLRDEGLAYNRNLGRASVSTIGRMVAGTSHGTDIDLGAAIPDVHAATIQDVAGFAHTLA